MTAENPTRNPTHKKREVSTASPLAITWVVVVAALLVTLLLIEPAAPGRIRLLTGPEGSTFHELGSRYADALETRGLAVEVITTSGGFDNVRRLGAGGDDAIAFAPSIVGLNTKPEPEPEVDTTRLVSLGSIGLSPLWLFYRSDSGIMRFADLAGRELATAGSGAMSDALIRRLLELHGIADQVEIRSLAGSDPNGVVEALITGRADAAFLTGSPQSELIRRLLHTDGISLLSMEQAAAYVMRFPGLTRLEAPQGVFDLARSVPGSDSQLIGVTINLVATSALHPEVAPTVLSVAADIRGQSGEFFQAAPFPNDENLAFPLARSARRYFQQGEVGLSKFLPYRVTRYLNHLGFLVLPILTIVVVVLKLVPMVLKMVCKLRLISLYRQLEQLERSGAAGREPTELLDDLNRLDAHTATMFIPRALAADYVNFRQFLHDMRERVQAR